jgi:hypothetical protein
LIHKSFTYAIVFQSSTSEILLTFVGLIVLSLIVSQLFQKLFPKEMLMITFVSIIILSFLSISSNPYVIFLRIFLDFLVFFNLVSNLVNVNKTNYKLRINLVLPTTILVFTSCIVLFLLLSDFVVGLLAIPVMISLHLTNLRKDQKKDSASKEETEDEKEDDIEEKEGKLDQKSDNSESNGSIKSISQMEMLVLFNSFVAGMIIPFGNSILALVNLSPLMVVFHFLPAVLSGTAAYGLIHLYSRRKRNLVEDLLDKKLNNRNLLNAGFVMCLFGGLYILFGNFSPLWYIISGVFLIQFIGTIIISINRAWSDKRQGRVFLYISLIGICFVLGFILNAIKGLFLYVLTFFVIKDGALLRRDPKIDPVTNINVPALLNGSVLLVIFLFICLVFLYYKISAKFPQLMQKWNNLLKKLPFNENQKKK